jgi:hypothetical protein
MSLPLLALAALISATSSVPAQRGPCGMNATDWCPAAPDDPCGRHRDVAACRADQECYGRPYEGESLVACILDRRGFASNCPTVGCTSMPPRLPAPARK